MPLWSTTVIYILFSSSSVHNASVWQSRCIQGFLFCKITWSNSSPLPLFPFPLFLFPQSRLRQPGLCQLGLCQSGFRILYAVSLIPPCPREVTN